MQNLEKIHQYATENIDLLEKYNQDGKTKAQSAPPKPENLSAPPKSENKQDDSIALKILEDKQAQIHAKCLEFIAQIEAYDKKENLKLVQSSQKHQLKKAE